MRFIALVLWGASALVTMDSATRIVDGGGRSLYPFVPAGTVNVLFFVSADCPLSNSYAPEIQRVCRHYSANPVGCALVYEDPRMDAAAMQRHLDEYRYQAIRAVLDRGAVI